MRPILSIVIANYNYGRFLAEAIESVLSQNMGDAVELVVCDAASTDNSVEILKRYQRHLAWWCSEPDGGQSDAFNKGFAHCCGKFLTWLNADDLMPAGCLTKIVKELQAHPECEWFTGNMFRFTEDGRVIDAPWGPHVLPRFLQTRGMPIAVYGPATIFTKRIFDAAGGMKIYQHFMMDTDLWMRFVMMGVKQRRINCFCWAFRMHIDSKTAEFDGHRLDENQSARFRSESQRAANETGYKTNCINRYLILIWRIFDGSIIYGLIVRCLFRHYTVSKGAFR